MASNLQSELLAALREEIERLGREIREDIQKQLTSFRSHHHPQSPSSRFAGAQDMFREPSRFTGRFHSAKSPSGATVPRSIEHPGLDPTSKAGHSHHHFKSYTARKYAQQIEQLEGERVLSPSDKPYPKINKREQVRHKEAAGVQTVFAVGKFMALRKRSLSRSQYGPNETSAVDSDLAIDEVRSYSGLTDAIVAPPPNLDDVSVESVSLSPAPARTPPTRHRTASHPRYESKQHMRREAGAAVSELRSLSVSCAPAETRSISDMALSSEVLSEKRYSPQGSVGCVDWDEQQPPSRSNRSTHSAMSNSRPLSRSIVVRGQTAGEQVSPLADIQDDPVATSCAMNLAAIPGRKLDPDSPEMKSKNFRSKRKEASGIVKKVMGLGQKDDSGQAWGSRQESLADMEAAGKPSWSLRIRLMAHTIVVHPAFEALAMFMIFANALHMGIVTDHMAQSMSQDVPDAHRSLEGFFGTFFFVEVVLRLVAHRSRFFTMWGSVWNMFDLLLVVVQLVEEVILIFFLGLATSSSTALLRCVRILRALRLLRLLRVTRFSQDLRMLITCIMNCGMTFIWACVLMTLLTYILSIYFTETLVGDRLELDPSSEGFEALSEWFGSVPRSALSLFQALTGGVDWNDLFQPLAVYGSPWLAAGLILYIVFNVVALLNLISAVFVQNAIQQAEVLKEQNQVMQARRVFQALDVDDSGFIDLHEMKKHLNNEDVLAFFESIDVDPTEVNWLFDLLDADSTGTIAFEEFLNGVLRLQGSAKAIDLIMITREIRRTFTQMIGSTRESMVSDGDEQ